MTRPAVLPALYVATAVTQALDAHSTMTALHAGAQEANPFMRTATSSPGAFLAIKAGAAAGTVLLAEKMWPRNRAGAIATMVAVELCHLHHRRAQLRRRRPSPLNEAGFARQHMAARARTVPADGSVQIEDVQTEDCSRMTPRWRTRQ